MVASRRSLHVARGLALLAFGSVLPLLSACREEAVPTPPIKPVMVTHPVPASDAVETFPGEVRARFEPELAFRIGGKISRRLVDIGQRVEQDAPLAELDPEDVRLQLDAMRAQVEAAEANFRLVTSERERYQTLLQRQLVSRSQFEAIENQYRAGEARLNQARAEYSVASNQATYAVLRAPQAGVIVGRHAEVGQVVAAGQKVFTLAAEGDREVVIGLPENSRDRFRVGQSVAINLWSQPEVFHPGLVRELAPAADAASRTFAARVAFADRVTPAELGQSARVFFRVEGEVPLAIPLSAVSAESEQPFVYRVDPATSTLQRVDVRLGAYGEKSVPVLEGLQASDWVVVAGLQVLREGQAVRPVDRDNRGVSLTAGD